jgi:ABC-2 type transport system permease protein
MLSDLILLTIRQLHVTFQMPIFALFAVIQPLVWMYLFGSAFPSEVLGLSTAEYITALAPGFAIMAAYFGSAFAGVSLLQDIERGVLHRQLTAPLSRASITGAYIWHAAILAIIQALLLLALATLSGGNLLSEPLGILTTMAAALCTAIIFGGFSVSLALLTRRSEVVLTMVNLLGLPLLFTSQILTIAPLRTEWLRIISEFNPVNLAATLARSGFTQFDTVSVTTPLALFIMVLLAHIAISSSLNSYLRQL